MASRLSGVKRALKSLLPAPARQFARLAKRTLTESKYPSITVVVPAYNSADYIWQCISSILPQLSGRDELIIINDGSTDATGRIIAQSIRGHGDRCRVVTQANRGLSASRNTGIELAKGEYICFVDSDDWLLPGAFAAWRKALTASPYVDILYSNRLSYMEDTGEYVPNLIYADRPGGPIADIRRVATRIAVHGKVWRRSMLLEHDIAFPVGYNFEDNIVAYKTLAFARSAATLRKPTYVYRKRRAVAASLSVTQQKLSEHNLKSRFRQIETVLDFVQSSSLPKLFPKIDWENLEYDRRLIRHLRPLPYAPADVQQAALALVRAFLTDHIDAVRRACRPEIAAIYEDIVAGRSDEALSAIDLLPNPDMDAQQGIMRLERVKGIEPSS